MKRKYSFLGGLVFVLIAGALLWKNRPSQSNKLSSPEISVTKPKQLSPGTIAASALIRRQPQNSFPAPEYPEFKPSASLAKIRPIKLSFKYPDGKADPRSLDTFRSIFKKYPVQIDLPTLARASKRFASLNPGFQKQGLKTQLIPAKAVIPKEVPLMVFMDNNCYSQKRQFLHESFEVPPVLNDIDLPIRAYKLTLKKDVPVRTLLEASTEKNCIVGFGQNAEIRVASDVSKHRPAEVVSASQETDAQMTTNDPSSGSQKQHRGYMQTYAGYDLFYDSTRGVRNTIFISIIDSGVQRDHRELAPNMWSGFGYNFMDNNNDPSDGNGHGTMVAGFAAARMNDGLNGHGVMGTHAVIMAAKALGNDGRGNFDAFANAVNWSVSVGAHVLNASLGAPRGDFPAVDAALANASAAGRVVVIAAGNDAIDAGLAVPAKYSPRHAGVMTVASTDAATPTLSSFSNRNNSVVEIAAPGSESLCSTAWRGWNFGEMACGNGTSYAAPLVAGTAGLMLSLSNSYGVSWHSHHIEDVMRRYSPGHSNLTGHVINGKYLDIYAMAHAVLANVPQARPPTPTLSLTTTNASPIEGDTVNLGFTHNGDARTFTSVRWFLNGVEAPNYRGLIRIGMIARRDMALRYQVRITNNFYGEVRSNEVVLNPVRFAPIATVPQNTYYISEGSSFSVSATVLGNPAPTFTWSFNNQVISGAQSPTLTIPSVNAAGFGIYTLEAKNSIGVSKVNVTLAPLTPPKFTTQPPATLKVGEGKTLTISPAATGGPPPTYQWFKGDTAIPGATQMVLNLTNVSLEGTGTYRVVAKNSEGMATSSDCQVTVVPKPQIVTQPLAAATVKEGENITFNVVAKGEELKYQWYIQNYPISNATGPSFTIKSAQYFHAGAYRVRVYNPYDEVYSNASVLRVSSAPVIIQHPKSLYLPLGVSATLWVGAIADPAPTFQWYKVEGANRTALTGQTTPQLVISQVKESDRAVYQVEVKNINGEVLSFPAQISGPAVTRDQKEIIGNAGDATKDEVVVDIGGGFDLIQKKSTDLRAPAAEQGVGK